MRICLHTIRDLGPGFIGGTERLLVELAKELQLLGHQPFLVSTGVHGDITIEGVPVQQRIPAALADKYVSHGFANSAFIKTHIMGGPVDERGFRMVGEYIDRQLDGLNADILHFNSFAAALFCAHTAGAVVTSHENDLEQDHTWGEGFTAWMARVVGKSETALHEAGLLTTPSKHYADFYTGLLGLPVRPIKAGIGLGTFDRGPSRCAHTKKRGGTIEVLLPARFEPHQKGHDIAMAACRILKERGVIANFTFSGVRNDYKHRLTAFQESAAAAGVSDRVTAKRFSDLRRGYDACDVVISPERFCSYGLSISEALALGIPTVLADIPTYREIAHGFAHAYFFDLERPDQLADGVIAASQTSDATCDSEAVRFRIANDLRAMAVELSLTYADLIRSSIVA